MEIRTACRRFLAAAASGDPAIFRRAAKSTTAAAAVCWVIGKANDVFSYYGGPYVKDLMAHFGLASSSVIQRARTFLIAGGFEPDQYGGMDLGSPRYLVSKRRASIRELRMTYKTRYGV